MVRVKQTSVDLGLEYRGAKFGDARLSARAEKIGIKLASAPASGFPTALATDAEAEGFYRFLSNAKVSLDEVIEPHKKRTAARCDAAGEVLIAIDKSEFAFNRTESDDLEPLSSTTFGFAAFVALAMTRERTPLGVLDVRPLEQSSGREPAREWALSAERALEHLSTETKAIFLMDREADAFELIATLQKTESAFVIRAQSDRVLSDKETHLRELVAREPQMIEREVELSRRSGKGRPPAANRKHPPRKGRHASLAVRACAVELPRPPKAPTSLPASVRLNVVHVTEPEPPLGEKAVDWLLLTSESIETVADVERVIDAYRARWLIEEYFKALKTGCSYEQRQLEGRKTLYVALGLLIPIAWQLLLVRAMHRERPELPASFVLTPIQLLLLQRHKDAKFADNPTVADALNAIARIAGHLKQNGPPGWQKLWQGFEKLRTWEEGFLIGMQGISATT